MAFKLTKQEQARRSSLVSSLNAARSELDAAVSAFNGTLEAARDQLTEALVGYNETLDEARGFAQDVASQAEQDISDKSERWQEGERGQAANDWQQEWEFALGDEAEIELPDDVSFEADDHAAELDGLPDGIY